MTTTTQNPLAADLAADVANIMALAMKNTTLKDWIANPYIHNSDGSFTAAAYKVYNDTHNAHGGFVEEEDRDKVFVVITPPPRSMKPPLQEAIEAANTLSEYLSNLALVHGPMCEKASDMVGAIAGHYTEDGTTCEQAVLLFRAGLYTQD